MKVSYSKAFVKAVDKLSGKILLSVRDAIYRIRIGNYRAFFTFHVQIVDDTVMFQYFLPRGEAYSKKSKENLRAKDK